MTSIFIYTRKACLHAWIYTCMQFGHSLLLKEGGSSFHISSPCFYYCSFSLILLCSFLYPWKTCRLARKLVMWDCVFILDEGEDIFLADSSLLCSQIGSYKRYSRYIMKKSNLHTKQYTQNDKGIKLQLKDGW